MLSPETSPSVAGPSTPGIAIPPIQSPHISIGGWLKLSQHLSTTSQQPVAKTDAKRLRPRPQFSTVACISAGVG